MKSLPGVVLESLGCTPFLLGTGREQWLRLPLNIPGQRWLRIEFFRVRLKCGGGGNKKTANVPER